MIQRQQTLWLLLSTVAAILCYMFPFATGKEVASANMFRDVDLVAGNNFFLLLLTGASMILSAVTIFLFKNRKQQLWLCLLGILISGILLFIYISQTSKLEKPVVALSAVLPVFMIAGYIMAYRGIRKDEQLVKGLDKLR